MNLTALKIKDFEVGLKLSGPKFYLGLILALVSFAAMKMYDAALYVNLIFPVIFAVLGSLEIKCNRKVAAVLNLLWVLGSAAVLFYLPQFLMSLGIGGIGSKKKILGVLFT